MLRKYLVAAGTLVGTCTLLVVVPASAASAATPTCTNAVSVSASKYSIPAAGTNQRCGLVSGNGPSDALASLQVSLNLCYIDTGLLAPYGITKELSYAVPDTFGPKTKAAVAAAQTVAHAASDGEYGPETRSKLKWYSLLHGTCAVVPL
jgi:peptidoglycan hydrolase-like protein with peptidoglycan-binding domain